MTETTDNWSRATRDAIHPSSRDGDAAYWESGREIAAEVLSHIYPDHMMRVMEFGSGDGRILAHVRPSIVDAFAADVNPLFLKSCNVNAGGVACYLWDGMTDPPEDLMNLDAVYSSTVFIHQTHTDGATILANLAKCLRSGGLLLADIPLYHGAETIGAWCGVTSWHPHRLQDAANDAGLVILETYVNDGSFAEPHNIGKHHARLQVMVKR